MIDFHASVIRIQLTTDLGLALSMPVYVGRPRQVKELPCAFFTLTGFRQERSGDPVGVQDILQEYEYTVWWSRELIENTPPEIQQEADALRILDIIEQRPYAGVAHEYVVDRIEFNLESDILEPAWVCSAIIRFLVVEREV